MEYPLMNNVRLLSDLKDRDVTTANTFVFMAGKDSVGDGLGGFYFWDATSVLAEETTYLNVVASNMSTTGKWIRLFQRSTTLPNNSVLVNNGGVKEFFTSGTTNASGQITVYLTDNGAANGNALFKQVRIILAQRTPSSGGSAVIADPVLSADLKTLNITFSKSNTTTLGQTLLSIAGVIITGLTAAPAGVAVQIKVEGN